MNKKEGFQLDEFLIGFFSGFIIGIGLVVLVLYENISIEHIF